VSERFLDENLKTLEVNEVNDTIDDKHIEKKLRSNIVIDLVTWRINVLIYVLVFIMGRQIIIQIDVERRKMIKNQ